MTNRNNTADLKEKTYLYIYRLCFASLAAKMKKIEIVSYAINEKPNNETNTNKPRTQKMSVFNTVS